MSSPARRKRTQFVLFASPRIVLVCRPQSRQEAAGAATQQAMTHTSGIREEVYFYLLETIDTIGLTIVGVCWG